MQNESPILPMLPLTLVVVLRSSLLGIGGNQPPSDGIKISLSLFETDAPLV